MKKILLILILFTLAILCFPQGTQVINAHKVKADTFEVWHSGVKKYRLPTVDGTPSQGLVTDGSGNVTWGSVGGGTAFPGFGTDHTHAAYGDHNHTGIYEPAITSGTSTQYYRGDKSWQTFPTIIPLDSLAWYHKGTSTGQRYPNDSVIISNNLIVEDTLKTNYIKPKKDNYGITNIIINNGGFRNDSIYTNINGASFMIRNFISRKYGTGNVRTTIDLLTQYSKLTSYYKNWVKTQEYYQDTLGLYPSVGTLDLGRSLKPWDSAYFNQLKVNYHVFTPGLTSAKKSKQLYIDPSTYEITYGDTVHGGSSMVYPSSGIAVSTGSAWGSSITGTNGYSLRYISNAWRAWPDSVKSYTAGYRMALNGLSFGNTNYHNTIDSVSTSIPYSSTLTKALVEDTTTGKLYRRAFPSGIASGDTTGEIPYWNGSVWGKAYGAYLKYTQATKLLDIGCLELDGINLKIKPKVGCSGNLIFDCADGQIQFNFLGNPQWLIGNNALLPYTNNAMSIGSSTSNVANIYATTFQGNLTGNVTGNTSGSAGGIVLPTIPASNNSATGMIETDTANVTMGIGDVVFIGGTNSDRMVLCNASAIATCPYCIAICTGTVTAGNVGSYLTQGDLRYDSWTWTKGGLIYVSTTGTTTNTLTQTAPSGANNVIMPIGVAKTAHVIKFFGNLNSVEHN